VAASTLEPHVPTVWVHIRIAMLVGTLPGYGIHASADGHVVLGQSSRISSGAGSKHSARTARESIRAAFGDKTAAELESIAAQAGKPLKAAR